jgi:hypothetical protein
VFRNFVLGGCLFLIAHTAFAQVVPVSGQSSGQKIQIGVAGSAFATDWNRNEYGVAAYADFDVYRQLLSIECETRFIFLNQQNITTAYGSGSIVDEKNYGVGPRIAIRHGRWVPYVKGLVGVSTVSWGHIFANAPNYTNDSYTYVGAGGGTDYRLDKHFRLRGEYQYQFWYGDSSNVIYKPNGFTAGVGYQF